MPVHKEIIGNPAPSQTSPRNSFLHRILEHVDLVERVHNILSAASQANSSFQKGVQESSEGNFEVAIRHFDKAVKLKPKFAEAYLQRSRAYRELGSLDQAAEDYVRAIKLKPGMPEAAEYINAISKTLNEGFSKILDEEFGGVGSLGATDWYLRALDCLERLDFRGVYHALIKTTETNQLFAKAYSLRSYAFALGLRVFYDESRMNGKIALKLDPQLAEPHFAFAMIDYYSEKYLEAQGHITKALELDPKSADILFFKGIIEKQLGNFEAAITAYEKSICNQPRNPYISALAYVELALLKEATGNLSGALENLNTVIELMHTRTDNRYIEMNLWDIVPNNLTYIIPLVTAYEARARVKNQLGDLDGSLDDLAEAIKIDMSWKAWPGDPWPDFSKWGKKR